MATLEEYICNLHDKYGQRFQWFQLPFTDKTFINEALSEINETHSLYGKVQYATAKCEANDDVLYLLADGSWAIIHLTYCGNNEPGYPQFILFRDLESVMKYIENKIN